MKKFFFARICFFRYSNDLSWTGIFCFCLFWTTCKVKTNIILNQKLALLAISVGFKHQKNKIVLRFQWRKNISSWWVWSNQSRNQSGRLACIFAKSIFWGSKCTTQDRKQLWCVVSIVDSLFEASPLHKLWNCWTNDDTVGSIIGWNRLRMRLKFMGLNVSSEKVFFWWSPRKLRMKTSPGRTWAYLELPKMTQSLIRNLNIFRQIMCTLCLIWPWTRGWNMIIEKKGDKNAQLSVG